MLQTIVGMSEVDNKVVRVTKLLKCLRRNHAALTMRLHGHRNLLNPTPCLPLEILGDIYSVAFRGRRTLDRFCSSVSILEGGSSSYLQAMVLSENRFS